MGSIPLFLVRAATRVPGDRELLELRQERIRGTNKGMGRRNEGTLLGAIAVMLVAPTSAWAGAAVAPVRVVAAVPAESGLARDVTFVGTAGQLYVPAGDGRWKREALGGVAVPVRGAFRGPRGSIYVSGVRAPLYQWSNGSWQVRPVPNRGRIVAAGTTGLPALAVEAHLYMQKRKRWTRLASHKKRVTALWAGDRARVYVGDVDGAIWRYTKGSFAPVTVSLTPADAVHAFAGRAGSELYAITTQGALLAINATRATTLAGTGTLAGARAVVLGGSRAGIYAVVEVAAASPAPHAPGPTPARVPEPATPIPAPAQVPTVVLVKVEGNALTRVDDLPPLPAGERIGVLTGDAEGWVLAATTGGHIFMRSPEGAWTTGQVSGELPASAIRSFDEARPAHSP